MKKRLAILVLNVLRSIDHKLQRVIERLAYQLAEAEVLSRGLKLNRTYRLQAKIRQSLVLNGTLPRQEDEPSQSEAPPQSASS